MAMIESSSMMDNADQLILNIFLSKAIQRQFAIELYLCIVFLVLTIALDKAGKVQNEVFGAGVDCGLLVEGLLIFTFFAGKVLYLLDCEIVFDHVFKFKSVTVKV
jgi:hypothetical protein